MLERNCQRRVHLGEFTILACDSVEKDSDSDGTGCDSEEKGRDSEENDFQKSAKGIPEAHSWLWMRKTDILMRTLIAEIDTLTERNTIRF